MDKDSRGTTYSPPLLCEAEFVQENSVILFQLYLNHLINGIIVHYQQIPFMTCAFL